MPRRTRNDRSNALWASSTPRRTELAKLTRLRHKMGHFRDAVCDQSLGYSTEKVPTDGRTDVRPVGQSARPAVRGGIGPDRIGRSPAGGTKHGGSGHDKIGWRNGEEVAAVLDPRSPGSKPPLRLTLHGKLLAATLPRRRQSSLLYGLVEPLVPLRFHDKIGWSTCRAN